MQLHWLTCSSCTVCCETGSVKRTQRPCVPSSYYTLMLLPVNLQLACLTTTRFRGWACSNHRHLLLQSGDDAINSTLHWLHPSKWVSWSLVYTCIKSHHWQGKGLSCGAGNMTVKTFVWSFQLVLQECFYSSLEVTFDTCHPNCVSWDTMCKAKI